MKTLELAQFGLEELSTTAMINTHGGGDSTSVGNLGSFTAADLTDANGNSLLNGDIAAVCGNITNTSTDQKSLLGFSSSR